VNQTLKDYHILVTRPARQADYLCQLIEQQGGVAVRFPTLQIVGLAAQSDFCPDSQSVATFPLSTLSKQRWLIFISANAVNFALKANGGKIAQFQVAQIAAIGQATAKALRSAGLQVSLIPEHGFDSEALLAMPQMQDVMGHDILIIRGQGGRDELASVLRSRGAHVSYWEVYKRVVPDSDSAEVVNLLERGLLGVIIITSFEALRNLVAMLGANYNEKLVAVPLVVISDRISRLAAELGFTRIAVAENPSDEAILASAIATINGE
jgi:uroporphyrinogen-III synthase